MDLSKYWIERGQYYDKELKNLSWISQIEEKNQEQQIKNFLKMNSFQNILEIGSGSGRLTKLLLDVPCVNSIVAIDISKDLIETARKNISNRKIIFMQIDILDFSTEEKFDLIFGGEILMHISPSNIKNVLKKLLFFSKKKLLFIEYYDENKFNMDTNGYVFSHNYTKIFEELDVKRISIHLIKPTKIQKAINFYANLRNRTPYGNQVIIEVDV